MKTLQTIVWHLIGLGYEVTFKFKKADMISPAGVVITIIDREGDYKGQASKFLTIEQAYGERIGFECDKMQLDLVKMYQKFQNNQ